MKDDENLQKEIIESIEAGWKSKEKLHQQQRDWSFYLKVLLNLVGPIVFFISLYYHPFIKVMDARTHQVLALALWMLIWWISEFIPLPATALLPIAILPSFGIVEMSDALSPYSSSVIFLFLGGFLIALALEKWGLHKRIALTILGLLGNSANKIILGFIIASAFLSMWISNTATAVMLLPIVLSVIRTISSTITGKEKQINNLKISMLLGIAYGASVGGMATLIGTPPNAILAGYMKSTYNIDIDFFKWMIFALPLVIVILTILYFVMTRLIYPNKLGNIEGFDKLIKEELKALGPVKREDLIILSLFLLAAILWMSRAAINKVLGTELNDASIAIAVGLLFFFIPSELPSRERLLEWKDTARLPWGILVLFGGGLSIAAALEGTGILSLLAHEISNIKGVSITGIILILMLICVACTEFMSNTALATIFVPIIASIGISFGWEALVFAAPFILATSCVFNLPMGTPPNAVIFASGEIKISNMIKIGALLDPICIATLTLLGFKLAKLIIGT